VLAKIIVYRLADELVVRHLDEAGNQSTAAIDVKVFPKSFRRSRIEVNDPFLQRVVPAILENTPDFKVDNPDDLVASYVQINRDLRQKNPERIP
jgi:hypothetical protein